MFTARMRDLAVVRGFVDSFCSASGTSHGTCLRLHLVAEELFTNTVKHGHRGGSEAPVVITLRMTDDCIHVIYEDQAPPFNPLAFADRMHTADHVEGGKEGGLGAVLAKGMSISAEYHYLFGHNRVWLRLALEPPT